MFSYGDRFFCEVPLYQADCIMDYTIGTLLCVPADSFIFMLLEQQTLPHTRSEGEPLAPTTDEGQPLAPVFPRDKTRRVLRLRLPAPPETSTRQSLQWMQAQDSMPGNFNAFSSPVLS